MAKPVKKQINIKMPEALIEALKTRAEESGSTFTDLVIRLCEQGLEMNYNTRRATATRLVHTPLDLIGVHIDLHIANLEARLESKVQEQIKSALGNP